MDITTFTARRSFLLGLLLLILVLLATAPLYMPPQTMPLMTEFLMYIVLTVSWAIFSGPTGYISLAPAAFFGTGIYVSAVLFGRGEALLPLPAVIVIGGLASFIVALLVGTLTLRLRGIYFTIFTFVLIELARRLVQYYEFNVTGTRGRYIASVDADTVFYVMLAIFVVLMLTAYFIKHSKYGLALQCIGENEEAAAHSGVNVTTVKVIIFAISAIFMGAAGAIIATRWVYIDPSIAFNFNYSFMPVLMAIVGGMGQLYGPVLGTLAFVYLRHFLLSRTPDYYMLIFGIAMVGVVLYMPNGLVGLIQRLTQKWRKGGSEQ
jgi:branched-chain amino acid transport system permease protein